MRRTIGVVIAVILVAAGVIAQTDTYVGRLLAQRGPSVDDYSRLPSRTVANAPGAVAQRVTRSG
jgi:hypothetical protein